TFNKPMQLQIFASEGREGDFIISEANRKTIRKIVIEDWASGVVESGIVNDVTGEINVERVSATLKEVVKYSANIARLSKQDLINLSKTLAEFGMFINPQVFTYLQKQKKLSDALAK